MKSLQFLSIQENSLFDTYREVESGGRTWLVVNGVPLVEGVLNKRFVPADEFGAFVNDWNDLPIVLKHPKQNGGSARVVTPDVPVVGRFYNAKLDGTRLIGEYWLDKQLLESAGGDGEIILGNISSKRPIETSTGYWSESLPESGKFNGRDYESVDKNIHPDHIALLSDEIGACSVKDGCGMNRNCQNCEYSQVLEVNHYGPGPHKDGSSQDVHGGKGGGGFSERSHRNIEYFKDVSSTLEKHKDTLRLELDNGRSFRLSLTKDKKLKVIKYDTEGHQTGIDELDITEDDYYFLFSRKQNSLVQNVTGSLPEAGKKMWEEIYQSALKEYDGDKEKAAATAWKAIKRKYRQDKDGVWHEIKTNHQNQQEPDLEGFALTLLLADSIS